MPPPPFSQTAVCLLQWGPLHEPDEPFEAARCLRLQLKEEGRENRLPHVTSLRVTEPSSASFLEALRWMVTAHRDLQVLYVAAHGVADAFCFDVDGRETLSHADFCGALAAAIHGHACHPVVVFGACYSLAPDGQLPRSMPEEVLELLGFTATPSPADVADLIAGVLKSDEEVLGKVTEAAAAAANSGGDVAEAAEAAFDAHESRIARFVRGSGGGEIRHLVRGSFGGWTGTTIPIRAT